MVRVLGYAMPTRNLDVPVSYLDSGNMRSSDGFVSWLRGDLPKREFILSPGAGSSEVVAACRTHRAIERPATVISYLIVI